MPRLVLLLGVFLTIAVVDLQAEYLPRDFDNTRISRHIDLRGNVVYQTFDIEARNIATYPVSEYFFRPYPRGYLAFTSAYDLTASQEGQLEIEYEWDFDTDTVIARVIFQAQVQPNVTTRFRFTAAHVRALQPTTVSQQQAVNVQWVRYETNIYADSIYFTHEMVTSMRFPTKKVVLDSGDIAAISNSNDNMTVYGPFYSIGADTYAPLAVAFEFTKPLLNMHHMTREIKLPTLGKSVKVEECLSFEDTWKSYDEETPIPYFNSPSLLEGVVVVQQPRMFSFQIPVDARDMYCRDMDGKLLTTKTTRNAGETPAVMLHCIPRQPPLGRNYTLCHGYRDKIENYLSHERGQQYIARVQLFDSLDDMSVDWMALRVLLPSGAGYPIVDTGPIKFGTQEFRTDYSSYITPGRPLIVLSKAKVIQAHMHPPIQIMFQMSTIAMLAGPASAAGIMAGLALFITLVYRIYSYSTEPLLDPDHLQTALLHLKKD